MKRLQNRITLVELAERTTLMVDVVDSVDHYQSYQDKGGRFSREGFYNTMFSLEEFVSGDARAKATRLFSSALLSQAVGLAEREKITLSDEQKWLYCLLRDNQVPIPQEEQSEAEKNPLYWSDHVVFAEVLKLPTLSDWKAATLPSLCEVA